MTPIHSSAGVHRSSTLWSVVATIGTMAVACAGGERGAQDTAGTTGTAAPAPPGAVESLAQTPQMIALGDSIFEGKAAGGICYTCHGPEGKGTQLGPNLTDQQWLNGDGSAAFIRQTIVQGVPNPKQHPGPMPALGQTLTPQQIDAVAAYVYSLSHPSG